MTFSEALPHVFAVGERVTRRHWANQSIYVCTDGGMLVIHGARNLKGEPDTDDKLHPWVIGEDDYFADDWEVVD